MSIKAKTKFIETEPPATFETKVAGNKKEICKTTKQINNKIPKIDLRIVIILI